jgi:hypothetical protein
MFSDWKNRLFGLLVFVCLCVMGQSQAQAAMLVPPASSPARKDSCDRQKHIDNWRNTAQLAQEGFNIDLIGSQASLEVEGQGHNSHLAFDIASNPASAEPTASRITEIKSGQPIQQRVKCWQATPREIVVAEYVVRFEQAATPPGLTENLMLWNAPLPSAGSTEQPVPITAVGVTRSQNAPYSAIVAQDLNPMTFAGTYYSQPMPAWLDATDWHAIRVSLSQTKARVEVSQGAHDYALLLEVTLPRPADPMALEFSLDNDNFLFHQPVTVPDGLDLGCVDIRYMPDVLYGRARPAFCGGDYR